MKTLTIATVLTALSLCACSDSMSAPPPGNDAATLPDRGPPPPPPDGSSVAPITEMPGHETIGQDTSPKRGPRLVPVEAYLHTYLTLFSGLAASGNPAMTPAQAQVALRDGHTDVFDTWNEYIGILGLPDYRIDIARNTQTSPIMLATLERAGTALCDVAAQRDLDATPQPAMAQRTVFAFDATTAPATMAEFRPRFDRLHRAFLGYPASLAPDNRAQRYFDLYTRSAGRMNAMGAPRATAFRNRTNAGWAAVCYALVRHPEFQTY